MLTFFLYLSVWFDLQKNSQMNLWLKKKDFQEESAEGEKRNLIGGTFLTWNNQRS